MRKVFALVDCNNFYASCERLFQPELKGRPVVVLSNNDGCIIARSNEAKELGISMGTPYFKCREMVRRHNVRVFSSNYALYGDLSQRVMNVLQRLEPEVEVYSIDEAFISLPDNGKGGLELEDYGRKIKATVERGVGLPVSIGIAPTKTLAKIANHLAKKDDGCGGVVDLTSVAGLDEVLASVPVGSVWGIGRRSIEKLRQWGVLTALDLKRCDDAWVRKHLTVTGLRTVMELRGKPCIALENARPARKSIVSSRSFGKAVGSLTDLREAISTHVSIGAEKLRRQGSVAGCLQVFILTNRFRKERPQHFGSLTVRLPRPTSHTPTMIRHALQALEQTFKAEHHYQKAGIILTDLFSQASVQLGLFEGGGSGGEEELMVTLDLINSKWGRDTVHLAAAGLEKPWGMKRSYKSSAYTTSWNEIPVVNA